VLLISDPPVWTEAKVWRVARCADGGGRKVNSSLQSSGSLYMSLGLAYFRFSRLRRYSAAHKASRRGTPTPQPSPAIWPAVKVPAVFAAAGCEGQAVGVADVDVCEASNAGATRAAIWDGRSTRPLPPVIVNVLLSVWQSVVFKPQTNTFVPDVLAHGVIDMLALASSAYRT